MDFLRHVDSLPLRTYPQCVVQAPWDITGTSQNCLRISETSKIAFKRSNYSQDIIEENIRKKR